MYVITHVLLQKIRIGDGLNVSNKGLKYAIKWSLIHSGFPRRLANLENENGHGKVMDHEQKSHGIL